MEFHRKLRYGMVGGGPGAFIGEVHRMAAALDGHMELVAGAFSSSKEKSDKMGKQLQLDNDRVYGSFKEMAEKEAALPEDERIDFVSVVTPNHLHYPVCKAFIEQGIHVVCDKPLTNTIEEAEELCRLVEKHDVVFGLTHTYTGYPMVKQAREMIWDNKLGKLRKIVVEYPQGWLSEPIEQEGAKQAEWRTDPDKAGISSAVGDIGTHAENLVEYITGLKMQKLYADITSFVEGRKLEDDANLLVHYEQGVKAILYCSQISVGEENDLKIRIYGTDASLEWGQENPNYLYVRYPDRPEEIYKRGNPYLSEIANFNNRIPPGHPEGFIEAFANIYMNVGRTILAKEKGVELNRFSTDFPTVYDGAVGVHFIHKTIESGKKNEWVDMNYSPGSG
ncbi:Gfo/Idh/MocA family oxidoreductase [Balneolaceae bacterium YR4-1]|uniref:Gfo/Idh/MocA family oxidoreductase n=1 Tax=Halalkalibaculum roseum TaxID=2709311 RepID=A0A6M1T3Q0_9BACT|nr:Gfo/Idh/MocA family oxidoreductase [Halalkalibaculum roseum]NGP76605.1 Gfo/Idh/MocA family oxidoreductase [Halalkalibaculum roseum]